MYYTLEEIEILKAIRQNLKTNHMAVDMWDGTTRSEKMAYRAQFAVMTKVINALDGTSIADCPMCDTVKDEAVKLYCVEPLIEWLTKGRVYESVDGFVCVDDGNRYVDCIMRSDGYLVPLVKRLAKVGEWVVCINGKVGCARTHKDTPVKVIGIRPNGDIFASFANGASLVWLCEYLVLDGFSGDHK